MLYRICIISLFIFLSGSCSQQKEEENNLRIENPVIALVSDKNGGAIKELCLQSDGVNFLSWKLLPEQMPENNRSGAPFQGHFLCYGRWGAPTEGEIAAGVPHNGHHNILPWEGEVSEDGKRISMKVNAPLDKVEIYREIVLSDTEAVFKVDERFIHRSAVGRISNIVQHITLGPPFLNESLEIYSNAAYGFLQENSWPDPSAYESYWPEATAPGGEKIDLSVFNTGRNYVSTHIFEDTTGWAVAVEPLSGKYIGYAWNTVEYPWINFWNHHIDGEPSAYGIEFGTAGIGRSYRDLVEQEKAFHGLKSYFFMDAGETVEKKYYGFCGKLEYDGYRPAKVILDSDLRIVFRHFDTGEEYTESYKIKAL